MDKFLIKKDFFKPIKASQPLVTKIRKSSDQVCLDFGQKKKSIDTKCIFCNRLIRRNADEDENSHGISCLLTPVRLLSSCFEISFLSECNEYKLYEFKKQNGESIKKLFAKMNYELGSPEDFHCDSALTIFCIKNNIAAGCIVVDKIPLSKVIFILNVTEDIANPVLADTNYTEKSDRITLGVRQIWVFKKFRGNGVARLLVEEARKQFAKIGCVLSKSEVAFSQPTSDGLKFAKSYSGEAVLRVY